MSEQYTYKDAGVDIAAGNALVKSISAMIASTKRSGADAEIGGFGGLFDLKAAGYDDPLLVAATDGVGTKLKLAIETGQHQTVGIDLVAMCVNDLIVQGAEPLFFLDYFATGKLENKIAEDVVRGITDGCKDAGCALIGGETAEMPGHYAEGDYDLAGFCVGAVDRKKLLPRTDISPGDKIIALSSSGIHSNGYSLVRKLISDFSCDLDAPPPFQSDAATLGAALMTPTRIYVRQLLKVLKTTNAIKALAHITGGGLTENIPRVLPDGLCAELDKSCLPEDPLFAWLAGLGNIAQDEMLTTFNCGIGMILVVQKDTCQEVTNLLSEEGEDAFIIGEIIENAAPVLYRS